MVIRLDLLCSVNRVGMMDHSSISRIQERSAGPSACPVKQHTRKTGEKHGTCLGRGINMCTTPIKASPLQKKWGHHRRRRSVTLAREARAWIREDYWPLKDRLMVHDQLQQNDLLGRVFQVPDFLFMYFKSVLRTSRHIWRLLGNIDCNISSSRDT